MRVARNPASGVLFSLLLVIEFFNYFVKAAINNNNIDSNGLPNVEQFQYCIQKSQQPRLRECVGRVALSFLQRFDEQENYTLANDLISSKDDAVSGRSLVNLIDTDPVDFRGILENAGAHFSQRNFEWHMDRLYPGLMLKIGPTADANSVAEFVIDPDKNGRQFSHQEPSTARVLVKQYLLPFLLGIKFKLVALVPLLFAAILLLLKKSLFLAKLAIYVSSFLGIGGAAGLLGAGLGSIGASLAPTGLFGYGIKGQGTGFDLASATGQTGYFPGKTVVFNQHYENAADELHQASPYKRSERKVKFENPRVFVAARTEAAPAPATATATTAATDHFYDYENHKKIQDRIGKSYKSNGRLGPSAYNDEHDDIVETIFKPSEQRSGWKVLDMRV